MLSRINDKRTYAASQLIRTMCAGQPYGIPRIGEPDDLKNITAKSLYAHYRDLLATSRVELFYMGSLSPAAVTKVLQTVLAELPRAEVFVPVGTTPAPAARPVQEKTERLDVTQGKLSLGFLPTLRQRTRAIPRWFWRRRSLAAARRASSLRTCARRCPSAITRARRLKNSRAS